MSITSESEKNATTAEAPQPKAKHTPAKKAKPAKKVARTGKPARKPKADRANKSAKNIYAEVSNGQVSGWATLGELDGAGQALTNTASATAWLDGWSIPVEKAIEEVLTPEPASPSS